MEFGEFPLFGPLAREAYNRLAEAVAFHRLQFRLSAEVGVRHVIHPDEVILAAYMQLARIANAQNEDEERTEALNVIRNASALMQYAILLSHIRQDAFDPQPFNPA